MNLLTPVGEQSLELCNISRYVLIVQITYLIAKKEREKLYDLNNSIICAKISSEYKKCDQEQKRARSTGGWKAWVG